MGVKQIIVCCNKMDASGADYKEARYIDGIYVVECYKIEIEYMKPILVGCSISKLST